LVFRWCWWMSFKENERRRGEKERGESGAGSLFVSKMMR